jgi:hypothetical protein
MFKTRRNKYSNKKVTIDGHKFDSQAEAKHYYFTLKPALERGEIRNLELQPRIRCEINGKKVCDYLADFRYLSQTKIGPQGQIGCQVVEDVKGYKTDIYKLKKKLVEALYPGTVIVEISGSPYRQMTLPEPSPSAQT